jgi:hypothetical protein
VQVEMDDTLRLDATGNVLMTVRNTGTGTDLYRLSASAEPAAWTAGLSNALVAVQGGQAATVRVHIGRRDVSVRSGKLHFTATSETDATKKASVTAALTAGR